MARMLRINRPRETKAGGLVLNLPSASSFFDTGDVDELVIAVKNLSGVTARNVTLDLADRDGNLIVTTANIAVAASATRFIVVGLNQGGTPAGGLNVDPIPIDVPPKLRVNIAAAGADGVEVTVYGRGQQ